MKAAAEFGVAMPKGVLIAGVPGCGKSLSAKAAGKLFDVPLLRLDMGRLMGKYVGESEENMRKAIRLAEAISPCILWVDELEKAFAGISSGGGGNEVTTRLFGTFLTWMQEKKSAAFVVATANDITKLPPELLRKGRFDEIFYVALPNDEERKKIFEIHLNKRRKQDAQNIDLNKLVWATAGYSGADIEGVVSESVENVYVKGCQKLTTEDILDCISETHSLSEIMKEERGLTEMLPQDTSVEVIGGFAGAAVDGAMALCDAANGTISMTEAMDRTGRAGVAAGCRIGAELLRGKVASIPVVGPIFVDLLGGLFDHLESSTFVNDVYTAVRNTAVATWNGVKESRVGRVVQNTWAAAKRVLS